MSETNNVLKAFEYIRNYRGLVLATTDEEAFKYVANIESRGERDEYLCNHDHRSMNSAAIYGPNEVFHNLGDFKITEKMAFHICSLGLTVEKAQELLKSKSTLEEQQSLIEKLYVESRLRGQRRRQLVIDVEVGTEDQESCGDCPFFADDYVADTLSPYQICTNPAWSGQEEVPFSKRHSKCLDAERLAKNIR